MVHKNVYRDCVKHVSMQRYHIAQWQDGFRSTAIQDDLTWRTTQLLDYGLFAKVKEPLRGIRYNTRHKFIRDIWRSIRNINKDGRADCVRRLPNTWQKVINKGMTTLKVHKCCTTVNKAMPKISNGCHYLLMSVLYNLITVIFPILC